MSEDLVPSISSAYGSGDSYLISDVIPKMATEGLLERLQEEVEFHSINHRGGAIPRLFALQGEVLTSRDGGSDDDRWIPVYRHPIDNEPPLLPWTPLVHTIKTHVEACLQYKYTFNHVLIQLYRDGRDHISEHSDKTLDIEKDSVIVNYSLGAQRQLVLKSKAKKDMMKKDSDDDGIDDGIVYHREKITLLSNSMFVLGWNTNKHYLHSIKQDKRNDDMKEDCERGVRISLTFRVIATFTNIGTKELRGQGVRHRSDGKGEYRDYLEAGALSEALLYAFSNENKRSDEWEETYGVYLNS